MVAAVALVLARYTDLSKVSVGLCRGDFAAAIPVATPKEMALRNLLANVQASLAGLVLDHSSFSNQVSAFGLEGVANRNPLFGVMVTLDASECPALRQDACVRLNVAARSITVDYNARLFRPEIVGHFLGHLNAALAGLLHAPEQSLGAVEILGSNERLKLQAFAHGGDARFAGTIWDQLRGALDRDPEAIVLDDHGTSWSLGQLTAGWRSCFSHCLLFNPTDACSARYNPLLEVRRGAYEVRDVQNIADILVDPEGALERRSHWEKTSHSLLVGAILHILYAEEEKTLARVAIFLSDPKRSFAATLRRMMTTNHLGPPEAPLVHPVVASAARELLNKSENERSGVLSTAMSFLGLYRDPTVAEVTSACDWRIADLLDAGRPVSLYLVIPPSDISRTKPLVRLVLNQIGRRLTEKLEESGAGKRRHQLLMMLDEFPALGRLDFFETALAFMAGYGVRAFLIAQSLNQIEKAYGEHNAILDNCHVRVAFATNDERTGKRISDALGTATEQRSMRNYAGHRLAPWLAHVMVSRQETARPLLTQGEVMQLPPADELVLISGMAPLRAQKLRHYEDRNFRARLAPPPVLSETGYADRPLARSNDWGSFVRAPDRRLAAVIEGDVGEDEGGLQQQRHPGLLEEAPVRAAETVQIDPLGFDDEVDAAGDARAMAQARSLGVVAGAHAMNEGAAHDPLPSF